MKPRPKPRAAPLPWDKIMEEVEQAARKIGKSRHITTGKIVDHIHTTRGDYPFLTMQGEWHPADKVTYRALANRVNKAIRKLGWIAWNDGRASNKNGRTFILPWMPEDPALTQVRKEVMAAAE